MSKAATELIFHTLRALEAYAYRYDKNYQEIAKALRYTIPWYMWPKNKPGEMLYQAVNALANDHLKTRLVWQKRWDCPHRLNDDNGGWYWLVAWAIHEPLSYYLKGL